MCGSFRVLFPASMMGFRDGVSTNGDGSGDADPKWCVIWRRKKGKWA